MLQGVRHSAAGGKTDETGTARDHAGSTSGWYKYFPHQATHSLPQAFFDTTLVSQVAKQIVSGSQ